MEYADGQTLTRAMPLAQDAELFGWLRALYPVWARMTPEMVRVSTRTAIAELLLSGCTSAEPASCVSMAWMISTSRRMFAAVSVRISEFEGHVGAEVTVRGWLHNKRSSGKLQFLILRDGSGYAQAVGLIRGLGLAIGIVLISYTPTPVAEPS